MRQLQKLKIFVTTFGKKKKIYIFYTTSERNNKPIATTQFISLVNGPMALILCLLKEGLLEVDVNENCYLLQRKIMFEITNETCETHCYHR